MEPSVRLRSFDEGIFSSLRATAKELAAQGRTVVDFSIGSPNIPPPLFLRELLARECIREDNYGYPVRETEMLLVAVKDWYARRFGLQIETNEIMSTVGAHDTLVHFCLTYIDPGGLVIIPDPCYPGFSCGPVLAGAEIWHAPTLRGKTPAEYFQSIPDDIAKRAKVMFVCYPNNPTTELACDGFYPELIRFAKRNDILIVHDSAYIDMAFDGRKLRSFLSYPEAKDVGIELTSLSKSFGIAGARVGFAVGNAQIIADFRRLKSNIDYNIFLPVQRMAAIALQEGDDFTKLVCGSYEARRDFLVDGLRSIGWNVEPPPATIFLWAKVPPAYGNDDTLFATELAKRAGVIAVPGVAFGKLGKGFVRFALVVSEPKMSAAIESIDSSGVLNG